LVSDAVVFGPKLLPANGDDVPFPEKHLPSQPAREAIKVLCGLMIAA
jgi:hypothetical protein